AAAGCAEGAAQGRAQERDQRCPRDPAHRVAKKLPRMRFVALKTARAAPRGASVSVRYAPTSREARVSCRADSDTITTVASNARTAFTPNSSNASAGWTTRSSARTVAAAPQRSSPAWEMIPSDSPMNSRPSGEASVTVARQRPLARRSNSKPLKRSRSSPGALLIGAVTRMASVEPHFDLLLGRCIPRQLHHVHLQLGPPLRVPLRRHHQDEPTLQLHLELAHVRPHGDVAHQLAPQP